MFFVLKCSISIDILAVKFCSLLGREFTCISFTQRIWRRSEQLDFTVRGEFEYFKLLIAKNKIKKELIIIKKLEYN